MFFDNEKYFNFVELCRKEGITVPIIPGIKPIHLKNQLSILPKIFKSNIPEALAKELQNCSNDEDAKQVGAAWCIEQCKELVTHKVPSIHFYTYMASEIVYKVASEIY
jgi:methylenetetrahydrofolate reductase (NADPH)